MEDTGDPNRENHYHCFLRFLAIGPRKWFALDKASTAMNGMLISNSCYVDFGICFGITVFCYTIIDLLLHLLTKEMLYSHSIL